MAQMSDLSTEVATSFDRRATGGILKSEYVSDADLVPEDLQNKLMFWRDTFRIGQFDIGDIAVEIVVGNSQRGSKVTHDRIFRAIGRYCGKSARTVRYYYETAVFYDPDTRQKYSVLPFSHFVLARSMGERWQLVLDFALAMPQVCEEELSLRFSSASMTSAAEDVPSDEVERLIETAEENKRREVSHQLIRQDNPAVKRHSRLLLFNGIYAVLDRVRAEIDSLRLSEGLKTDILGAIDTLSRNIPEILRMISNPEE